jgi:hypothetical protein
MSGILGGFLALGLVLCQVDNHGMGLGPRMVSESNQS